MKDILNEIVEHKRLEVARQKEAVSLVQLREQIDMMLEEEREAFEETGKKPLRRSMKQSLAKSKSGIIAEFKRRSPSKGWIKENGQVDEIPSAYEAADAAARSILTDEKFFGGALRDVRIARQLVELPIIRKDFIIDEYQLLQARILGADAVLLIAACLTKEECAELTHQAHDLGLEVLLEVHHPDELDYILPETDMVGVNNRNLGTFHTDVENSFRIAHLLQQAASERQESPLLISESGISKPETIRQLREAGFRGFLIGETFMSTPSPGETLKQIISEI